MLYDLMYVTACMEGLLKMLACLCLELHLRDPAMLCPALPCPVLLRPALPLPGPAPAPDQPCPALSKSLHLVQL